MSANTTIARAGGDRTSGATVRASEYLSLKEAGIGLSMLTPQEIEAMTPEEADAALIAVACVLPFLVAKARERREPDKGEWMTVKEAAAISGLNQFYFYDHQSELPFCEKFGRSVRVNRVGLRRWLQQKNAG